MISLIENRLSAQPLDWRKKRRGTFGHHLLVGLTEFWPLDEQAGTRRGVHAGRHLTDNNTVTGADGIGCLASQITEANTEYFSIADNTVFQVGTGDFTVGMWFNADTVTYGAAEWGSLFAKFNANGVELFIYQGNVRCYVGDATNASIGTTALSTGTWYRLICRRSGTSFRHFLNGATDGPGATNSADGSAAGVAINLGRRSNGTAGSYYGGKMFNAFFAKNRAWTDDEIAWDYNGGRGRSYPFV